MSEIRSGSTPSAPQVQQVRRAISEASRANSVDFSYLLAQARIESGLDPQAQAPNSSASGLFQFIDSTWLSLLKRHGESLGLQGLASAVSDQGGKASIADPAIRHRALALRNDPQVAAHMAARLALENRAALLPVLGREPDGAELYLAHFLGESDALRFVAARAQNPSASAAAMFPLAAASNRPIFFTPEGEDRSLDGVMVLLKARLAASTDDGALRPGHGGEFGRIPPARLPTSRELSPLPPLSPLAAGSGTGTRMPISQLLKEVFLTGTGQSGGGQQAHARLAYARFERLGL